MRKTACVLATALLAACAPPPAPELGPVASPRASATVRHIRGSPLSGGTAGHLERLDASDALRVAATFVALPDPREDLLAPLGTRARLVASPTDERPLLAAPRLAAGARVGIASATFLDQLGPRAAPFAELGGALPRGVTVVFEVSRDHACAESCEPVRERFAVLVHRRAGAPERLDVGLELGDAVDTARSRREVALVDAALPAPGEAIAAIVPSPFDGDEAHALCAIVTVEPAPAPGAPGAASHARTFAACVADLAREAALASAPEAAPARPSREPLDLDAVRSALRAPPLRRAALFALARSAGAALAEDVAVSSDDATVAAIASSVASARGADAGWLVERAALVALRDRLAGEEPAPQAAVLLARRVGALARSLGTLSGTIDAAKSIVDLDRRLVDANRDLLEDGSPAVRARAHEWLRTRDRAVAGYDPLAPAAERRAALERAAGGRP